MVSFHFVSVCLPASDFLDRDSDVLACIEAELLCLVALHRSRDAGDRGLFINPRS